MSDHHQEATLIKLALQLVDEYDPKKVTPTTHFEKFVETHKVIYEDEVCAFLQDVLYGWERYANMLKIVVDGMFGRNRGSIAREDRTLYEIFTYITMIKLEEMEQEDYLSLILSQPQHKMVILLDFLFGEDTQDWVEDQLCLVFDHIYVEEEIMETLNRQSEFILPVLEKLQATLQQGGGGSTSGGFAFSSTSSSPSRSGRNGSAPSSSVGSVFTPTVPRGPNLTKPKPRPFPEPTITMDTTGHKAKPVPEALNRTSLKEIEAEKRARKERLREEIIEKHSKAEAFEGEISKRPMNLEELKREKERELQESLTQTKARPVPTYPEAPPVKLNTAAILREDALFRKKQEQEAAIIRAYEVELRDSAEFDEWKAEMMEKDEEELKELIRQRKKDAEDSAVNALQAIRRAKREKKKLALLAKEESKVMAEQRKREAEERVKAAKQVVEEVIGGREKYREVAEALAAEKRLNADELIAQKKANVRRAEREKEKELEERKEHIKKIQAMEKVAAARAKEPKMFDPTETSGVGYLDEISMVEARERIYMRQVDELDSLLRKKKSSFSEKRNKQERLIAKVKNISRLRSRAAQEGSQRVSLRRKTEEKEREEAKALSDEQSLLVYDKIQSKKAKKRAEAKKLAAEIKQRRIDQQFLNSNKAQVEAIKWRNQLLGAERQLRDGQDRGQQRALEEEETQEKWHALQIHNQSMERKEKKKKRREYERKVTSIRKDVEAFEGAEMTLKQTQAALMKSRREESTAVLRASRPYATKVNEMSLKRSQALQAKYGKKKGEGKIGKQKTVRINSAEKRDSVALLSEGV